VTLRRLFGICILTCVTACAAHRAPKTATATRVHNSPAFTDSNPADTVPYLASDALQGRGVGLPGLDRAADFIAGEFTADGLRPLPRQTDFFQRFDYVTESQPAAATRLVISGKSVKLGTDFLPMRFSAQGTFAAPAVFVGYGVSAPDVGYDDYAGIDVKGKVAVALRYEPMDARGESRLASGAAGWSDHAALSAKAQAAADHGAVALLIVNPLDSQPDLLIPFSYSYGDQASIPVDQIKQPAANQLLAAAGAPDLKTLRDGINRSFHPHSMPLPGAIVQGTVQIRSLTAKVKNVMAMIPGAGPHADEFVVVGAHYDHLGLGLLGHALGPPGSIYHGADDNASGTATVLELAHRFAHAPPPARSIVLICFTAEEEGLVGSQYFVRHPPIPLKQIVAMVNMDMVGRVRDQTLYIGGQGTAKDFDAVLAQADLGSPLRLKSIGRGGLGPSDHMSFAMQRIPVLFFFSGIHIDYHRPTDVASKINYEGIGEVADFTQKVLIGLTRIPHDPYLVDADRDSMHLFGSLSFGPSASPSPRAMLGVIPDYGSAESRVGVLISGTTPGTPADAAGLRGGDLLVQFGKQKLENLMDLSQALARSKPGDKIILKLIRGSVTLSFDVTLAERKG
jgi:Zn-dependent M28 family amino/carboxypeptidase